MTEMELPPPRSIGWNLLHREGVQIACLDFGGRGPPVLLLHGLAGHAAEWTDTARWLTESHRVLALDLRGHGRSEHAPGDVSRGAHVADVAFATERLGSAPVVLVGQSLGGHLAMLVAARHPTLVRGLVVVEASPAGAR
jgi:pimeloyl-ACP methyl ester carboxylesterase